MKIEAETEVAPLGVQRLVPSAQGGRQVRDAERARTALGAIGYGVPTDALPGLPPIALKLLSGTGAAIDLWQGGPNVETGRTGAAHWRCDGDWLFGWIDIDQSGEPHDLAEITRGAYRDVFKTLDAAGIAHLQRIWNYIPAINDPSVGAHAGLERYRQFNAGRQQAFIGANYAAFDGAPAACALGTRGGPLAIRFLAGRRAPVAIENPRQVSAYRYPSEYGARAPTFSRAALVELGDDRLGLLISGTASIVGHRSIHSGDVRAQTAEALRNLEAVIEAARGNCSMTGSPFDLRQCDAVVYVRHAADVGLVREVIARGMGIDSPMLQRAMFLEADICRSELLVEIEAHAIAAGRLQER